jgi:hypothetical protein
MSKQRFHVFVCGMLVTLTLGATGRSISPAIAQSILIDPAYCTAVYDAEIGRAVAFMSVVKSNDPGLSATTKQAIAHFTADIERLTRQRNEALRYLSKKGVSADDGLKRARGTADFSACAQARSSGPVRSCTANCKDVVTMGKCLETCFALSAECIRTKDCLTASFPLN